MIKKIFYSLIGIFVLILSFFFIPVSDDVQRSLFPFAGILAGLFFILGIILIVLTAKSKIKKKLFLILTGASSAGFLVCVILHNFLYALAIVCENIMILKYLFEFLHVAFFLIGILICPILFLISVIISIMQFKKRII